MMKRSLAVLALLILSFHPAAADSQLETIVRDGLGEALPGMSVRIGLVTLDPRENVLVVTDVRIAPVGRSARPPISIARVESRGVDRSTLEAKGYDPFAQALDLHDVQLAGGQAAIRTVVLRGGNSGAMIADLLEPDRAEGAQRLLRSWRLESLTLTGLSSKRGAAVESVSLRGLADGRVDFAEVRGLDLHPADCRPHCMKLDVLRLENSNLPEIIGRLAAVAGATDSVRDARQRREMGRILLESLEFSAYGMERLSVRQTDSDVEIDRLAIKSARNGRVGRFALTGLRVARPRAGPRLLRLKSLVLERGNPVQVIVGMSELGGLPRRERGTESLRMLAHQLVLGKFALEDLDLDNQELRLRIDALNLDEWRQGGMHGLELEGFRVSQGRTLPASLKLDRLALGTNTLPAFLAALGSLSGSQTGLPAKARVGQLFNLVVRDLTITRFELEDLSFQRLPIAVGLEDLSLAGMKNGVPEAFRLEDLKVVAGPAGRLGLDEIAINASRNGAGDPTRLEFRIDNLDLSSQIGPLASKLAEFLGQSQASLQAHGTMDWDWKARRYRLNDLSAKLDDQVELALSLGLGLPPAGLPLETVPLEHVTFLDHEMALTDRGLIRHLVDQQAKASGLDRAGYLEGQRPPLRRFLSGFVGNEGVDQAAGAVMDFLESGGTLGLTMAPRGDPPTLPEVDAQRRQRALHRILDVAIERR